MVFEEDVVAELRRHHRELMQKEAQVCADTARFGAAGVSVAQTDIGNLRALAYEKAFAAAGAMLNECTTRRATLSQHLPGQHPEAGIRLAEIERGRRKAAELPDVELLKASSIAELTRLAAGDDVVLLNAIRVVLGGRAEKGEDVSGLAMQVARRLDAVAAELPHVRKARQALPARAGAAGR